MKAFLSLSFFGWAFLLTGCASDLRTVPVPPQWSEPAPLEAEPEVEEAIEIPELAEGVRLFHEELEVPMEALARGKIPEGSLIQVSVKPDVRHSVVSETLIQLHSMGYLVGIRSEHSPGESE